MQLHKNRPLCAIVISTLILSACTSNASKISATYVSPLTYQDMSCRQIRGEIDRVSRKVQEVTGVQNKEAEKDAWAMGVGLVLFWPALFFLMGDDKKEELRRLKGEYEALEQTAIKNNCGYVKELQKAKAKREAEVKKKAEEERKQRQNFTN